MIMVCCRKVSLGRAHHHQAMPSWVSETTLAIELDGEEVRVVRRTTALPVRNIKAVRAQANAEQPDGTSASGSR